VLDAAVTGGSACRTSGSRRSLRRDGAPHAQKNTLKSWVQERWCIPTLSADCVWWMEDSLDLYAKPCDRHYPLVCCDEKRYQWVSEVRQALTIAQSQPLRYDNEYRREGTCHLFMCFEPLQGWRHVNVSARRTAQAFAHGMQDLVDIHFPAAVLGRVVLDNLNTHTPAALYATFPPAEACRILRKLAFTIRPSMAGGARWWKANARSYRLHAWTDVWQTQRWSAA
jgi:hypothetical protein